MNKLKLKITEQAQYDIKQITEYIAKDNIKSAQEMAISVYSTCTMLAEFPQIGVR